MSLGWIWGEKKKGPLTEAEVETINAPTLKKDTRVAVKLELDINHPIEKTVLAPLIDSRITFTLPDGYHVQACRVQDIDILS